MNVIVQARQKRVHNMVFLTEGPRKEKQLCSTLSKWIALTRLREESLGLLVALYFSCWVAKTQVQMLTLHDF